MNELPERSFCRIEDGFSLIELMIVLAIIAILMAIAYPSYLDSVRKGKRAEGRAALANLLQQQERYMTQNNEYYLIDPAGKTGTPFKTYSSVDAASSQSAYLLGARLCQKVGSTEPTIKECVEVYAAPQSGVFSDEITELAMDTMGRRRCTPTAHPRCWQ